jgi:hypothetical protein
LIQPGLIFLPQDKRISSGENFMAGLKLGDEFKKNMSLYVNNGTVDWDALSLDIITAAQTVDTGAINLASATRYSAATQKFIGIDTNARLFAGVGYAFDNMAGGQSYFDPAVFPATLRSALASELGVNEATLNALVVDAAKQAAAPATGPAIPGYQSYTQNARDVAATVPQVGAPAANNAPPAANQTAPFPPQGSGAEPEVVEPGAAANSAPAVPQARQQGALNQANPNDFSGVAGATGTQSGRAAQDQAATLSNVAQQNDKDFRDYLQRAGTPGKMTIQEKRVVATLGGREAALLHALKDVNDGDTGDGETGKRMARDFLDKPGAAERLRKSGLAEKIIGANPSDDQVNEVINSLKKGMDPNGKMPKDTPLGDVWAKAGSEAGLTPAKADASEKVEFDVDPAEEKPPADKVKKATPLPAPAAEAPMNIKPPERNRGLHVERKPASQATYKPKPKVEEEPVKRRAAQAPKPKHDDDNDGPKARKAHHPAPKAKHDDDNDKPKAKRAQTSRRAERKSDCDMDMPHEKKAQKRVPIRQVGKNSDGSVIYGTAEERQKLDRGDRAAKQRLETQKARNFFFGH